MKWRWGPKSFTLSDSQWGKFKDFLKANDFTFESLGERRLKKLGEATSELDYLENEDIEALLEIVKVRKGKVLQDQDMEIKEYLHIFWCRSILVLREPWREVFKWYSD